MHFKSMFLVAADIEELNRDVQVLLDGMADKGYVLLTLSTHALMTPLPVSGPVVAHYALLVFKTLN